MYIMTKEETKEFCRDWGIKDVNAFEKYEK